MTIPTEHGVDIRTYARVLSRLQRTSDKAATFTAFQITGEQWDAASHSWKNRLLREAENNEPENLQTFAVAFRRESAVSAPSASSQASNLDMTTEVKALSLSPTLPFKAATTGVSVVTKGVDQAADDSAIGETGELRLNILDQTLPFTKLGKLGKLGKLEEE